MLEKIYPNKLFPPVSDDTLKSFNVQVAGTINTEFKRELQLIVSKDRSLNNWIVDKSKAAAEIILRDSFPEISSDHYDAFVMHYANAQVFTHMLLRMERERKGLPEFPKIDPLLIHKRSRYESEQLMKNRMSLYHYELEQGFGLQKLDPNLFEVIKIMDDRNVREGISLYLQGAQDLYYLMSWAVLGGWNKTWDK